MNSPCTSKPCSLSSKALTAESTPPDKPTMTRAPVGMSGILRLQRCGRAALAGRSRSCLSRDGLAGSARAGSDADGGHGRRGVQVEPRDRIERQPPAVEIVLHTPQHKRTAQPRLTLEQLRAREPMGADDPVIEGLARVVIRDGRSEEHTSELQSLTNLVCRLL